MKKKLSFIICLLVVFVFTAKAQYANMPKPISTTDIKAFSPSLVSFSPDSRYVAVVYKDIENIEYITVVEIATGKEVNSKQAGYPWQKVESSKYELVEVVAKDGKKIEEKYIKEKITEKKIYGIDNCITVGSITEATISPNNNFVAMISYEQSMHSMIELYTSISVSTFLRKALEGSELGEGEEEAKTKQRIISLGKKIAQLSIFRVNELPSYISFPTHTLKLPKGIKYFDDCYCGNYIEISSENESTKSKRKYGIANRTKIIAEPKYENIYKPLKDVMNNIYDERYMVVENNNLKGLVELATGREVVPLKYNHVFAPTDDGKYAQVGNGNLYGIVDLKTGKEVVAVKYETIDIVGNNASVKENGNTMLIDLTTGKGVISEEVEDIFRVYPLEDNRVIFIDNKFMGKIKDTKTNTILGHYYVAKIAFKKDAAFINGLCVVYKDKTEGALGGFINKKGDLIIPLMYEYVTSFSEGLAAVKKDGKWGFIDGNNKVVIPFIYEVTYPNLYEGFVNGRASLKKDGKSIKIDKTGKCVEGCN
jgi:hypothetical protein